MKDLYKQFNDIDIDVSEFEEIEVSELEKAHYKRDIRKRIVKKTKKRWLKGMSAACLSLSIGGAALVGLSYTTFAQEIPIVSSIIKLFTPNEKILSGYEEFAEPQHIVVSNNGTTITVTETLFDSKKFLMGYYIETDSDLGEHPLVEGYFTIDGQFGALFHAEHDIQKIGNNKYAGITTAILPLRKSLSEANFEFVITSISASDKLDKIEGNWNFEVYAKATETSVQQVKLATPEIDQLAVEIVQITYTPISFIVNYKEYMKNETLFAQWGVILSRLEVKDDLGNLYHSRFNGGYGEGLGVMDFMLTFEKLHPNAKQLIVTPYFELKKAGILEENGMKRLDYINPALKEIIYLDEIIIDIQK